MSYSQLLPLTLELLSAGDSFVHSHLAWFLEYPKQVLDYELAVAPKAHREAQRRILLT